MVAGGKYTTYRVMAKDAVDAVVHALPWKVPQSCTDTVPLVGAEGYAAAWNQRRARAERSGVHVAWVEHLLNRYGTLTDELLELVREHPELGEPMEGAPTYLRVEAYYAALAEGALHLDDILTRRTRISIETFDRGPGLSPAGRGAGGAGPRLGPGHGRRRGRALPRARRRRAAVAEGARRPHRRPAPACRPRPTSPAARSSGSSTTSTA